MKKNQKSSFFFKTVTTIVLIIISAVAAACTSGNDNISDERGNMNIDFGENGIIRNGTEYYSYQVEANYRGVISIIITKDSGRIDLDIYPTDRTFDTEYTGRDLNSASFSVILDEPGEYTVKITAEEFVGDYIITWKTEEITLE